MIVQSCITHLMQIYVADDTRNSLSAHKINYYEGIQYFRVRHTHDHRYIIPMKYDHARIKSLSHPTLGSSVSVDVEHLTGLAFVIDAYKHKKH